MDGHGWPGARDAVELLKTMPKKPKFVEFHVMTIGATPAKLVGIVRATNEKSALAEAIERYRIPPHVQKRLIVLRAA